MSEKSLIQIIKVCLKFCDKSPLVLSEKIRLWQQKKHQEEQMFELLIEGEFDKTHSLLFDKLLTQQNDKLLRVCE